MGGVNNLAGGGGPPHDSHMEARIAVLEEIASATKQGMAEMRREIQALRADMQRDFRLMFGALIAATLGLAALMAKGFHWF